jgi:hypothetical protein
MQRVTNTNRLIKRHILDRIDTILIGSDTLLSKPCLVGELLLCHAAFQSEFPHAHVSILP